MKFRILCFIKIINSYSKELFEILTRKYSFFYLMFTKMDLADRSKEELLRELAELQQSYNDIKGKYETANSLLKQAEDQVSKSEDKLRKTFMTSPDAVNINRLSDGMYISVNEGFTKILGYTWDDVAGKTSLELNIWTNEENRKELVKELQKNGRVENFEALFQNKNGNIVYGLMSASLIDIDGVTHILNITKDISIRKRIEEALSREQFLVNALMNNLTDHVYFKDRESRFIRINRSHALSFGLKDPEEATGKTDFDFFSEEHAQQAFDDELEIMRTGEPISKEEKLTWHDRPTKWSSTIKLPLRGDDGKIIGTFGISRDITEQKKSEEQIFLLANALKSINECVSITDINDKVLFLNKAFVNTYGFSEDDLKSQSISAIRSPNNPDEIVNEILPATLQGGWFGELFNRKKDGSDFLVSLSTAVVKNKMDEPIAMIGVASDITERKRIEMENNVIFEITRGITTTSNLDELLKLIHQSISKVLYAENFFVALYDQTTDLFSFPYFVDKFDTVPPPTSLKKSCTAYVLRTLKPFLYTPEFFDELIEKDEVELVGYPSPSWIGIPLQTPSKVIGVLVLQHYEKEKVYSETDLKLLVSIGSQIAISIERKKTEDEIRRKNELLQITNAEKDKFFSIIAHDLRGPLSAFVGATQILTEEIQSMTMEEIKEITLAMKTSADNIYSLLENLLEWSRLRQGRLDFLPENLNLKEKVEDCVNVLSEYARKKEIDISISIRDTIMIKVDNHMFDSVIRNLVSNAVKFTPSGGKVNITADLTNDHYIEVRISDSGIGMTQELKNKLFLLNEKTSRPGTRGEASTGLGLLLCKEFIEKNGGKIRVESEPGKGSTFCFTVPESSNI